MPKVFEGLWRKIAPFLIGLSAVGWLLVVIGFAMGRQEVEDVKNREKLPTVFTFEGTINDGGSPNSFPLWVVSLSGIPLFLAAAAHAALWTPYSSFCGVAAGFLSAWFVSSLGMILYWTGSLIRTINDQDNVDIDIPDWFSLEFAGAFLALLFWTPVLMLWPLYDTSIGNFNYRRS